MSSNLEDWWDWRRAKDSQGQQVSVELVDHRTRIAVLEVKQKISDDNDGARRSHTPQIVLGIISVSTGILFYILQLVIARMGAGTP